jgi:hypothetical protein
MNEPEVVFFEVVGERAHQLLFEKFGKLIDYHRDSLKTSTSNYAKMKEFMEFNGLKANLIEVNDSGSPLEDDVQLELEPLDIDSDELDLDLPKLHDEESL